MVSDNRNEPKREQKEKQNQTEEYKICEDPQIQSMKVISGVIKVPKSIMNEIREAVRKTGSESADLFYNASAKVMCEDIPEGTYKIYSEEESQTPEVCVYIDRDGITEWDSPCVKARMSPYLKYKYAGLVLAFIKGHVCDSQPMLNGYRVLKVTGPDGREYFAKVGTDDETEEKTGEKTMDEEEKDKKTEDKKTEGRKVQYAPNGEPYADYTGCTIVRCKNPNVERTPDGGFVEIYKEDRKKSGKEKNGTEKEFDAVSNPRHYTEGRKYEPIDVAEDWGLDKDAYLFNALKYISRAGRKGDATEDLKKARYYLDRRINGRGKE